MKTELGGKRLHSDSKMTVELHPYGGASHNLSKKVRTSMAPGTLVPVYTNILTPGDKFTFNITAGVRTLPAIGPLFGSFQLTIDVFTARMSLYNKLLHNNRTSLARTMDTVYFPRMAFGGPNPAAYSYRALGLADANAIQVGYSSLMSYLGIRGLGHVVETTADEFKSVVVAKHAMFFLQYFEIYKEYYANKQEDVGYVIVPEISEQATIIREWEVGTSGTVEPDRNLSISAGNYGAIRGNGLTQGPDGMIDLVFVYIKEGGGTVSYAFDTITSRWGWRVPTGPSSSILIREAGGGGGNPLAYGFFVDGSGTALGHFEVVPGASVTVTEAKLIQFPLENIELMRDAILAAPKQLPLAIASGSSPSYPWINVSKEEFERGLPYSVCNSTLQAIYGGLHGGNISNMPGTLENQCGAIGRGAGLVVKTYKSDRFNSWLDTEFVAELTEAVAIDTSSGSFTINSLNTAEKLYNIESRIAATAQTYKGWIEAAWGISPKIEAEVPIYRGGLETEITFDEVVSNSAAEGEPLGTLAGRGNAHGSGHVSIQVEEPSLVMAIASITPRIGYTQGNRWHTRLETFDELHKPEYDGIGYQPLITDEMAAWSTPLVKGVPTGQSTLTDEPQWRSIGKQVAFAEYMTDIDENFGDFADPGGAAFMVLNRDYEALGESSDSQDFHIKDATTYIDPSKHNYAFASTSLDAQNFWVHINFEVKTHRKVANKQIPRV